MAKNYEYEHTHIELKHGYATFLGKDFKPSDELLNALNKMAELAYNECGGLKVNTGGRQLTIPDVSKRALTTTEIVQKWPDGTEEVKYRRPYGSDEAKELMNQVDERACKDGYFYRHVC